MSDKEYFCTVCGSSYRFGGGDLQYEVTNILCPSCSDEHIADLTARLAAAPDMLEALGEIEKGVGAFSMDSLTHAENTIENMKSIATEAIRKAKGE